MAIVLIPYPEETSGPVKQRPSKPSDHHPLSS